MAQAITDIGGKDVPSEAETIAANQIDHFESLKNSIYDKLIFVLQKLGEVKKEIK